MDASGPFQPPEPPGAAGISAAAERARAQLHEELERVRAGVEEMVAESGGPDLDLQRELDSVREETRLYVKKRTRRSERKLEAQVERVEGQTQALSQRLDQVEADRQLAEWRIHNSTEQLLDGLLAEVRAIADVLSRT